MVIGVLAPHLGAGGTMLIGARLRKLREERKLSQGDITDVIGLPRSYISRIENGHAVPSLETLQRLAAALDVPLYRIFYTGADAANGRAAHRSLEELADDPGPLGREARFLIEMRELTKDLGGTERIFLMNLARKLATRRSIVHLSDSHKEREVKNAKSRSRSLEV
jgi:transcriptional regulator with XRE-family HTH domain